MLGKKNCELFFGSQLRKKENLAKTEEVREIDDKYEIPSFEEFMKTYESDGNVNYDDLSGGYIRKILVRDEECSGRGKIPCSLQFSL